MALNIGGLWGVLPKVYSSARGGLAAMLGFSQPASLQLAGGSYEKAETGVEGGGRLIGDAHSTECVSSCLPFVMLDKHPFFTYGPGDRGISEEEFTAQPVPR